MIIKRFLFQNIYTFYSNHLFFLLVSIWKWRHRSMKLSKWERICKLVTLKYLRNDKLINRYRISFQRIESIYYLLLTLLKTYLLLILEREYLWKNNTHWQDKKKTSFILRSSIDLSRHLNQHFSNFNFFNQSSSNLTYRL